MYTSRRNFIKQGALLVAATSLSTRSLFAAKGAQELVGLQLYSVRDDMKNDPLGTLKQLSAMGYKHVEHANYNNRKFYGHDAKEFKKILRRPRNGNAQWTHRDLVASIGMLPKKILQICGNIRSKMLPLSVSNLLSVLRWRRNFGKLETI